MSSVCPCEYDNQSESTCILTIKKATNNRVSNSCHIFHFIISAVLSCNEVVDDVAVTLNTLRPRQDGRHFPDDILKCIFVNEKTKMYEFRLRFH